MKILPLLATLIMFASSASQAVERVLFEYQGKAYTIYELPPKLRLLVHELELEQYAQQQELVDALLYELHLKDEAAAKGLPETEVAKELLKFDAPTAADIEAFYEDNEKRIGEPLDAVRGRVAAHLRSERIHAAKADLLARLKQQGRFQLAFPAPLAPPLDFDLASHPVKGPADAAVTVIEFGDYACPLCRNAANMVKRLLQRYPDDFRYAFFDYPLSLAPASREISEGSWCAEEQGKYWEYHFLAFDLQGQMKSAPAQTLASQLGLDLDAFKSCLRGAAPKRRVNKTFGRGRKLGLLRTPSVFVNGRSFASQHLEQDLEAFIKTRQKKSSSD